MRTDTGVDVFNAIDLGWHLINVNFKWIKMERKHRCYCLQSNQFYVFSDIWWSALQMIFVRSHLILNLISRTASSPIMEGQTMTFSGLQTFFWVVFGKITTISFKMDLFIEDHTACMMQGSSFGFVYLVREYALCWQVRNQLKVLKLLKTSQNLFNNPFWAGTPYFVRNKYQLRNI